VQNKLLDSDKELKETMEKFIILKNQNFNHGTVNHQNITNQNDDKTKISNEDNENDKSGNIKGKDSIVNE